MSKALPKSSPLSWPDLIVSQMKLLRGYAFKLTKNREDAEDLAQDVLLKALQSEGKFEAGSNLRGWLTTMMYHLFVTNYLRKKKAGSRVDVTELQNNGLTQHSTHNAGLTELFQQEMDIALDELPENLSCILRHRAGGYKYEELAERMSMPVGTVKNRIHLGRQALEKKLNRTSKTILSIPMSNFAATQEERYARWKNLFTFLDSMMISKTPVPLPGSTVAAGIGVSEAQTWQMIKTLVEMNLLIRHKEHGSLRYLYDFGPIAFADADLEQAIRITKDRVMKSVTEKKQQPAGPISQEPVSEEKTDTRSKLQIRLEELLSEREEKLASKPELVAPAYTKMSKEQVAFAIEQIEKAPMQLIQTRRPLGYFYRGDYFWFETDQQAIDAATELLKTNGGSELALVRQAGMVKLEPKIELY